MIAVGFGVHPALADGTPQTYSLSFSNSDLSMFDPTGTGGEVGNLGSFSVLSNIPSGVANVTVGGIVNTFIAGRYGAHAGVGLHGTVGVDFNFEYYDGSLSIAFPQDVSFTMDPVVSSTGSNTINIANTLTGQDVVQASSPALAWDVQGNIDLGLGAFAEACFGGCVGESFDILSASTSFTLLDFNQNRDDRLRLFGDDALAKRVDDGLSIPISRNLFLSPQQKLTQASIGGSSYVNFDITLGTVELNQLNLAYQNNDADGFSIGGANDPSEPVVGLYADVFGIASAAGGLPFNPLNLKIDVGPVTLEGKLFQLLAGGKFGVGQAFDFDPNMMVTFHASQDVQWAGGDAGVFTGQKYTLSLADGGSLNDITFDVLNEADAAGLAVVPEVYLLNPTLTNHTYMTFGPSVLARALELKIGIKGVGLSLGPAFEDELLPTGIETDIDLFHETMNIGNQPGLSKRYFMPSLTGVGGGPSELTEYANVDVARGALVFETPIIGGSVTLRDQTIYRNAAQVAIDGRLEMVDAPDGAPNLYFGNGIASLDGILRVGANSIADATGAQQDIADGGNPSTAGQGAAQSTFVNASGELLTGVIDVGGTFYYNGHAVQTIGSDAGVIIHGDGRVFASGVDALGNLGRNDGVLSIQSLGSVQTSQGFTNHGLMAVVGGEYDSDAEAYVRSMLRSEGFTNLGLVEVGDRGVLDTTGANGTGTFGNVAGNGTLAEGTFIISGGQIIYSGQAITTNDAMLVFTDIDETNTPFVHRTVEAGGSFTDVDGLASLQTNRGTIALQATANASAHVALDSLVNVAGGTIVLDVTSEQSGNIGSTRLELDGWLDNDGTLRMTGDSASNTDINLIESAGFTNTGVLEVSGSSTVRTGNLGNLNNGTLSGGGEWHIDGKVLYQGGNEAFIRTIAQGTTLNLAGELRPESGSGTTLSQLEHNAGSLTFHDVDTIGHLHNSGELILPFYGAIIAQSISNSGSIHLGPNAQLNVSWMGAGEIPDIETIGEGTGNWDSVFVHSDGELNFGNLTVSDNATVFYAGYDITTINSGTNLTFDNVNDHNQFFRLTSQQNNMDSYSGSAGMLDLASIQGELHLVNGSAWGRDLASSNLAVEAGGLLRIDATSQFYVNEGATLEVAGDGELVNDGLLRLGGSSGGATLAFTGGDDAVLQGTPDSSATTSTDVVAASGVITLGHVSQSLPGSVDELDFVASRVWTGDGAIQAEPTARLVNQDQLIAGQGVIDIGSLLNRSLIFAEGAGSLTITARQNLITNAGILLAGGGTDGDASGMILGGFGGGRLTLNNFELDNGETLAGLVDVQRKLYVTDADIVGGRVAVGEAGRLSLHNASITDGQMSSDGRVDIEANSTTTLGGVVDLRPGSVTHLGGAGGATLAIAADGVVSNAGALHVAAGSTIAGAGELSNSGLVSIDGPGLVEFASRFTNLVHVFANGPAAVVLPADVDVLNGADLHLNMADGRLVNYGRVNVGAVGGVIDVDDAEDSTDHHAATLTLARNVRFERPVSPAGGDAASGSVTIDESQFGLFLLGGAVHVDGADESSGWGGHALITGLNGSEKLTNVNTTLRGHGNVGDGMLFVVNRPHGTIEAPATAHLVIEPNAAGFTNHGTVRAEEGGEVEIVGRFNNFSAGSMTLEGGSYDIAGTLRFAGASVETLGAQVTLHGGGQVVDEAGDDALAPLANITAGGGLTVAGGASFTAGGDFDNAGLIGVGAGSTFTAVDGGFANFVTSSGTTTLVGGRYDVAGTLQVNGAKVDALAADLTVHGGGQFINEHGADALASFQAVAAGGSFTLVDMTYEHAGSFTNEGAFNVAGGAAFNASGSFTQSAGTTLINGAITTGTGVHVLGGAFGGAGTVVGSLVVDGGDALVSPGNSPGTLTITEDYAQSADASLLMEIGGAAGDALLEPGVHYDQIVIANQADLAGELIIAVLAGPGIQIGETFVLMTFDSLVGQFDTITGLTQGNYVFTSAYTDDALVLTRVPEPGAGVVFLLALGALAATRRRRAAA